MGCRILSKISNHSGDLKDKGLQLVRPTIRPTPQMWFECELDKESHKLNEIVYVVNKIQKNINRYLTVAEKTGVPVWVMSGIHFRESSLSFEKNMVNGQELGRRTTIVPKGLGPWRTWEASALDAFKRRTYDVNWSIPEWLDFCEKYNGTGYRSRGLTSPYVWGYTNQSDEMGKYVRDHVFDFRAENKRPGIAAILEYSVNNKIEVISGKVA